MAASQQLALRAFLVALLSQAPPLAVNVFGNRDFALAEGVASQIHVNVSDSKPAVDELFTGSPIDWTTTFEILVKARKTGTTEASDVCDGIWLAVYARVFADASLGGRSKLTTPGEMAVDTDEADTSVAQITWYFTAVHRTANNALT